MKRIIFLLGVIFASLLFSCTTSVEPPKDDGVCILINGKKNVTSVEGGEKIELSLSNDTVAEEWTVVDEEGKILKNDSDASFTAPNWTGNITITAKTADKKYSYELQITLKNANVTFINNSIYQVTVYRDGLTDEIAVVGAGGTKSVYVSPGRGEITFHFRYSYCVIDDAYSGTVWMDAEDSSMYTYAVDSVDIAYCDVPVQIQIPAPKNPTFRDSYLVVENISEQPVSLYNKNTQNKLYNQEKYYIQPQHSGVYSIQPDAPFEGFSLKSSSVETAVSPFHAESGVVYKCEFDGSGAAAVATEYVRQRELYTVTFEANGGTEILPLETSLLNEPSMPVPEKQGYQFAGWYVDGECRQPVEYPYAVNADTSLYAKWIESGDTAYTVKHYQQNTDFESYTLTKTEPRTGTTGTPTAAAVLSYKGFTARPFEQKPIAADGTTVVEIYYDRNGYTVTFDSNNGTEDTATQIFYYGVPQNLNENVFSYPGYTFIGWGLSKTGDVVYANQAEFCGEYTAGITLYAKWFHGHGIIATADTVGNINLTNITGEYTIKVVEDISQSTLTTLADKMKYKKDILVNLDLSEAVLETIEALDTSTSTFPNSIFYDCPLYSIVLPETLETIGDKAFYKCYYLEAITIPASVKTIGCYAFSWCENLKTVEITGGETIGESAFSYCRNLESVRIDGAETVGDGAFNDCTSLTSVIIGKHVRALGKNNSNCFDYCVELASVQFEDTENWYRYNSSDLLDVTDAKENAWCLSVSSERAWVKR